MKGYRWNLLPEAPDIFLRCGSLPPLLRQLLYNRGVRGEREIEPYLAADRRLAHDPLKLPDMEKAVIRIYRALLSGENIAAYGDYDVDGVTATALLVSGISGLGGKITPYIPHRLLEGHGLNNTALKELRKEGISLIITADTGTTDVSEVKDAGRVGLDIIITDHHTPLSETPEAVAIINPKLAGSSYPFPELSGAGVAYKLLEALYRGSGREELLPELTDLVALGTIADIAPLVGENRYLVRQGLELMNTAPRIGIKEMKIQAGLEGSELDSEAISWTIAPRLNAAGRLSDAMDAYHLLVTDSPEEAKGLAATLEEKNTERQHLTARVIAGAREQILAKGVTSLLIASDSEYSVGIIGLAAGKLMEEFYRPVVILATGDAVSTGSCRSIPEFNIILALNDCRHLLLRYGGHSQAAGFTLLTRNLGELKERLSHLATSGLAGKELSPAIDIDAETPLSGLSGDTFPMLKKLSPFGRGNPPPIFLSRRVRVTECRSLGSQREHLWLKLRHGGVTWDSIAFNQGDDPEKIPPYIDIVYSVEVDRWQGRESLRLNVQDFKESD